MDPIALTVASLLADTQRMNVIANNSANALTPGFRRELLVAAGQFRPDMVRNHGQTAQPGSVPAPYIAFDPTPGTVRQTSNPLDVALLGKGYFEVQTANGPAYTRQGDFRLDAQGRLVTQAGLPVTGIGGEIVLGSGTPVIDRDGKVLEQGKQVGQFKIVEFERNEQLRNIGGGLYVAVGSARGTEMVKPRLAQGQLESSNVDSAREMSKLIETYRHFESSSRVLQAYDEMRDKTFRTLGQF